jgi:hypothetical protein
MELMAMKCDICSMISFAGVNLYVYDTGIKEKFVSYVTYEES